MDETNHIYKPYGLIGEMQVRVLKGGKNPNPKSPYFNTRMEKIVKNQF
jgi:hypothetical protein